MEGVSLDLTPNSVDIYRFLKFAAFFLPVDSLKSFSPLVDDTPAFSVPFRPYDWSGYPASAVHGLYPGPAPSVHGLYAEPGARVLHASSAYAQLALRTYGRHTAGSLLFHDGGPLHSHHLEAHREAPPDVLCASLVLNGAYKCVKCSKVRHRRKW